MNNHGTLVLLAVCGHTLTQGASRARAQDIVATSSAIAPAPIPSSTTLPSPNPPPSPTPPNPFQPPPPQPIPTQPVPTRPDPTQPPSLTPPIFPGSPAAPKLTDAQLRARVRTTITQAPLAANGQPAVGTPAIGVTDLVIISTAGKVTLRGIVHSERERFDAGVRAAAVAGEGNVLNELTVR